MCIFYVSELVKYVIHALTQQSLEIANKILKNWNKNINISKICNLFLEFSEFSDIRDVLSVMISESWFRSVAQNFDRKKERSLEDNKGISFCIGIVANLAEKNY